MKPKLNREYTPGFLDNCQSPDIVLVPLLPYLNPNWIVWECAAGEGLMVKNLERNGFRVLATDILPPHPLDFLTGIMSFPYDVIITNPPFKRKYEWLEHCYELCSPFALLLPLETLGAGRAQRLFQTYGMQLILFRRRINYKMPHKGWNCSAQFPSAWFTWKLNLPNDINYFDNPKQSKNGEINEN